MSSVRHRQAPSSVTTTLPALPSSPSPTFRDPSRVQSTNIMHDPRVIRGSTYTASPPSPQPHANIVHRKPIAPIPVATQQHTPPVAGRKHADIQTDVYLEEILDAVPEAEISTQTDTFLDRPEEPLFVPKKSGEDNSTQIEEGELFDLEFEVAPIVEVLLGKVLEQAMMEVTEEEELKNLRMHQKAYENKRNAELVETQRLEDAERRRTEEKDRRLKESAALLAQKKETAAKIASRAFTTSYLSTLMPSVMAGLTDAGFFHDSVTREVEMGMLPWISNGVISELKKVETASKIVDDFLLAALRMRRDGDED